jgi:hypothetical protein
LVLLIFNIFDESGIVFGAGVAGKREGEAPAEP